MPLPEGPGIAVSVDYFAPLQVTPRGNTYFLLFTDDFSNRADMYAVTATNFTAEGTVNSPTNRYVPFWGCPRSILLNNSLQFFLHAVCKLFGARKLATSSYHPNGNGGVERVNHTMAQKLAMVVNEIDWDEQPPYVELRTTVRSALPPV